MVVEPKAWEHYSEEEVLEANKLKYGNEAIVQFYEDFEESKYSYREYDVVFSAVVDMLMPHLSGSLRAVDICGGAGKGAFTIKKCCPKAEITLVDLSEKMLGVARKRAAKEGFNDIKMVLSDAYTFLNGNKEYDIIIFSSAVHHFKDPVKLLETAARSLSPRGVIITIADPNRLKSTRRYKFFEFLATDKTNKKTIIKNLLKNGFKGKDKPDIFDVAEYQAYYGIDDLKLRKDLEESGLNALAHIRYPAGESYLTKIMPYFGLFWAFSFILTPNDKYKGKEWELKHRIKRSMPFAVDLM
ncbi:class I SAM-dependent methyltransferase [Thermosyntropha sp.]|uniref:class I SAM-dependent methyltransferase n=1 Tax=Thermosyntropha sp. TaxID=2740820 RepID=UPI0025DC2FBE|nr:class I SAM-dependent methyltransferase [Thermosyntropha sp.]MBO8159865.1 methyltransferase domain-containing protein [Thermosyntropha sp.]